MVYQVVVLNQTIFDNSDSTVYLDAVYIQNSFVSQTGENKRTEINATNCENVIPTS